MRQGGCLQSCCPPELWALSDTLVLSLTQHSKIFFGFLTRMSPVPHHPLISDPQHSSLGCLSGKANYEAWSVDSIIRIKPFRLVFASITDSDNQGKVPNGSIIDRDNQVSFSLIITDNQVISPRLSQPFQFWPWFTGPNRWHDTNLI